MRGSRRAKFIGQFRSDLINATSWNGSKPVVCFDEGLADVKVPLFSGVLDPKEGSVSSAVFTAPDGMVSSRGAKCFVNCDDKTLRNKENKFKLKYK